jgi:hypothetical protein
LIKEKGKLSLRQKTMHVRRKDRKKERNKENGAKHTKTELTKVATLLVKLEASSSSTFAVTPASSQSLFFG